MPSPRNRRHAETLVLAALDLAGGAVESGDGRATAVLQQIVQFPTSDQLLTVLGHMARDEVITRDMNGKRTNRIEITGVGRALLAQAPAEDRDLGIPASSRPHPTPAPPAPAPRSSTVAPIIAGGKNAPTIDLEYEDPPTPPAKPRKLQLDEALAERFDEMRSDNAGRWSRLARFPSGTGAGHAARKLTQRVDGFTFKAVRNDDGTSTLFGIFGEPADG